MERKGCESIGCLTHHMTLSYDLDLGFSRSSFELAISQEWEGQLTWNKRDMIQQDVGPTVWSLAMTLNLNFQSQIELTEHPSRMRMLADGLRRIPLNFSASYATNSYWMLRLWLRILNHDRDSWQADYCMLVMNQDLHSFWAQIHNITVSQEWEGWLTWNELQPWMVFT